MVASRDNGGVVSRRMGVVSRRGGVLMGVVSRRVGVVSRRMTVFPVLVLLVNSMPLASSQTVRVVIEGVSAELDQAHNLRCNVLDYSGSAALQYEWREFVGGAEVQERMPDNLYFIPSVKVADAKAYECLVFESGSASSPLVTGTASLNVSIPNFTMRFAPDPSSLGVVNYIGLNISYPCQTLFRGSVTAELAANVEIYGPGEALIVSGGRVGVTDTVQTGGDFERSLYFAPLSAEDRGVYRCTGTIQPVTDNPLVTNGIGHDTENIFVFDPILAVEISAVNERYLDIAPYNSLALTCTATVTARRVAAPSSIVFSWWRAVDSSPLLALPVETFTSASVFGSTGTSVLSVLTEQAGRHNYSCRVSLDVSPATDNITGEDMASLEVRGEATPMVPENLTALMETLSSNSATIQWHVVGVQYTPEEYRVLYGTSMDNLTSVSAEVSSGNDITLINFERSVDLVGLEVITTYYFQVEANNTVDVTRSTVGSFMTTDLPPTPPRDFAATRDATTPTTFVFTWTPPADSRGDLSRYDVTCEPAVEGEATPIKMPFGPTVTTGTIENLMYRVTYGCFVRARNMAAFSQPSNTANITVSETAPGVVTCGEGWDATPTSPQANVTVVWSEPANANGITLGYTLSFVSFGGEELATVNVSAPNTSYTFSNLTLRDGVPYNVSIVAQNSAGTSSQACFQTDFSNQLVPSGPVPGLAVTRSDSGTTIEVSWTVLSLVEAMGFLEYEVEFQPVASSRGKRRRRQGRATCSESPCQVSVETGGVTITGLDPETDYTVSVLPMNREGDTGENSSVAATVPRDTTTPTPATATFPLLPVIVGVVVGALAVGILIVVLVIVILCCCVRKKSKEHGVPGRIRNLELEKRQDYVNDTVLCDQQAPLYTPVPVKERLRVIPVAQFPFHVQDMHANRDGKFEVEYESLGSDKLASCEIAQLNKAKNRFANIFPYDFSRVKLNPIEKQEGSDYINASYIDGYKQANAYIAAQGPMPNTIGDFWRMIWEHKLTAVIMLTKVNEAGKKKCEQYWPDAVGQTVPQPNTTLEVTLKELMPFADYEIRKLEVLDVSTECNEVPLPVVQYHFLGWPDHGVPKFATSLIEFIRRVRHGYKSEQPILVHCGAGVGRTGTYITLDSMLERMKETDNINVYEFVRNMRAKRVLMVQTQAQYMFIHDALEELITCGETCISSPHLRDAISSLNKVNSNTAALYFEEQFKLLNKVSRVPTDSDLSDALQHYNESKNRYQHKIPYNNNRVRLRPTGTAGAEYINASFVDGYKHRNAYIATQGPLENTVHEFWRMIWEFKSKVIVMLCQTQEDGKESSYQYWPEKEGEEMAVGKLQVTLQSEKVGKEYVERKLEIKEPNAEGMFVVTQFHYQQWPEHDRPSKSVGLLKLIKSLNNAQRNTGNKPVTVVCNDGVGRTGSFICIHAMLERVNTENILDFFQFIKSSRIHRPSLVMELEHYRFCHDALADYLNTLDSYANFKDLS